MKNIVSWSEFPADDQTAECTPEEISLAETLNIAEVREEPRVMLTLSDISAIFSPPQAGESGVTSLLQAFMMRPPDIKAFSQESLSLSTTFVIANFEPAARKQEFSDQGLKHELGMVCEQHSYMGDPSTVRSDNGIIVQETQSTTPPLTDQAIDDLATVSCQPATPKFVPEQAAGQGLDIGSLKSPAYREQSLYCETDRFEDNIAAEQPRDTIQPVETLSHFVDQRAPVALSQLPVDLANSAQIEQLLPYLSLADGGKANLVQKQCANPSDHEKAEQPHKLPGGLTKDWGFEMAHVSSATNVDDGKKNWTSEISQALSHEDAIVTTPSTSTVSLSIDEQRAKSTDASKMALNATLLERVDTSDPGEAALEPPLPERRAVLGPKTTIRGGSIEEPIIIDASGDEQEEEDFSSSGNHSKSRRVRVRPQQPDGVVMWTDPKVEEGFLRNMRAIWYRIQAQWMEVRQLPGLNGMLSVVQYNKSINAIARKSAENDVLIHDDVVILQNQYKRVARQALHTLSSRSDRNLVRLMRRYMNRLHDESQMVKLIMDHPMKDDEEDVDYRPAKSRRC
tara:strand:- start:1813 stop:3513 length:1701 start_codon:yes stop_codon:yes gene_type:complete